MPVMLQRLRGIILSLPFNLVNLFQMRHVSALAAGIFFLVFSGCFGTKYIEQAKLGETALQENDHRRALEIAEAAIGELPAKQKTEYGRVYTLAGNASYALEQYDRSIGHFEQARQLKYRDETMYLNLAGCYRGIDNLSKEIGVLEEYIGIFPDGMHIGKMRERLFQTCRESMNYDQAMELWPQLDQAVRAEQVNMELFLEFNNELGLESDCDELAAGLLDNFGENEVALRYLAEKFFRKAENSYLAEMKAYRDNRTQRQYARLLEAFKVVNSDFRKSLGYFNRLYKVNPAPEYADFLSRIYTRMEDEERAAYYRRRAGQD